MAQALRNHFWQKEEEEEEGPGNTTSSYAFSHTSLFPVLMVSLFGPQQGQILQAHYGNSRKLHVRMSRCFNFSQKSKARIELCLSFILSKPRVNVHLEFPGSYDKVRSRKRTRSDWKKGEEAVKKRRADLSLSFFLFLSPLLSWSQFGVLPRCLVVFTTLDMFWLCSFCQETLLDLICFSVSTMFYGSI